MPPGERGGPGAPFIGKPAAFASVGGRFGGVRVQLYLCQIALDLGMLPPGTPELLVQAGWEKFDSDGNLTHAPTRQERYPLRAALASWTHRLHSQ